jgi:hypothetical protein
VIVGFFPMPYVYNTLSRVVLCLTAAFGFARAVEREKHAWLWVFGAVAVLHNPVLPVRLGDGSQEEAEGRQAPGDDEQVATTAQAVVSAE